MRCGRYDLPNKIYMYMYVHVYIYIFTYIYTYIYIYRLYVRCGRYDLLNKMYQASGQWEKAVEVAQKKDRIHLKVTHHLWARHLEAAGNVQAAIDW